MKDTEKVIEALRGLKAGITSPEVAVRAQLTPAKTRNAILNLRNSGTVLRHAGDTPRTGTYTLNPDKIEDEVAAPNKRTRTAKPAPKVLTMHDLAERARDRNGLAQRHMASTLKLLEDAIDLENDSEQVRELFALHKEAVQLAGLA